MLLKRKTIIVVILCCICLCGCSFENSNSGGNKGGESVVTDSADVNSIDELYSLKEFSGEFDFEYVKETDCQTDLGYYPNKAYTDAGYYLMEYDDIDNYRFLKYYDYASEQLVYVCGKGNCAHNSTGCDAYFDNVVYPGDSIWYYEGYIYTSMMDEDYFCICKVSPDGSTREKVCTVTRINIETEEEEDGTVSESTYYPIVQLHRGYVYYTPYYSGNTSTEFCRIRLDGSGEKETICTISNYEPIIYRIKPYGRYVFFQMGYENTDSDSTMDIEICAFDTEELDGVMGVCDNAMREYTVLGNKLYYIDSDDDIHVKNLEDGEESLFYDLDTEDTYAFQFSSNLYAKDNTLIYEIIGDYTYIEETDTYIENIYQLLIDEDGTLEKTLNPEDEKVSPY